MAIAVHKRSIYPAGHPIQQGASDAVHARLSDLLQADPEMSIGVAERRLMINGMGSDDEHPLIAEFAVRLGNHQIGAVRIVPGVTREELDAFLGALASPADEGPEPLGRRRDTSSAHIAVHAIAFEHLGLLTGRANETNAPQDDSTWRALAAAALRGEPVGGEVLDPRMIADAIGAGGGDDDAVIDQLAQMLEQFGTREGAVPAVQRQRLSELIAGIGETALARLLEAGGAEQGAQVLRTANDSLAARAVVDLVRAAASTNAVSISGSMLRLLQKLSVQAQLPGTRGTDADRVLRNSIRRLLDGWTLENTNPEMYERVLGDAGTTGAMHAVDRRRDVAEPERIVDVSLETQTVTRVTEKALRRLALRDGVASVLERLQLYPETPARETLVDRLLNEVSLREYLGQAALDVVPLRQVVDRLKGRAAEPLLVALEQRTDIDAVAITELLARIGWDVLSLLGGKLETASPRLLRHLIAVFERLDAWPPQIDPADYATHADVAVRREAIKYLLGTEATRDQAVLAALRDREVRVLSLGLAAVARKCSPAAARLAMARYSDPELTPELRVRAIRAAGVSETSEAMAWLGTLVITRRWIVGSSRLRKPSAETTAAASAIVTHYPDSTLAQQVVALVNGSRQQEYRRALTRSTRGQQT